MELRFVSKIEIMENDVEVYLVMGVRRKEIDIVVIDCIL